MHKRMARYSSSHGSDKNGDHGGGGRTKGGKAAASESSGKDEVG